MPQGSVAILSLSVIAAAALTQNRAVTGVGTLPAAAGRCLGFTRYPAAVGERVTTDVLGTTLAEAGAAFAADAALELDALGRVVTKNAGVTVARAVSAAGAAGAVVEVLLIPN